MLTWPFSRRYNCGKSINPWMNPFARWNNLRRAEVSVWEEPVTTQGEQHKFTAHTTVSHCSSYTAGLIILTSVSSHSVHNLSVTIRLCQRSMYTMAFLGGWSGSSLGIIRVIIVNFNYFVVNRSLKSFLFHLLYNNCTNKHIIITLRGNQFFSNEIRANMKYSL